MKKILSALTALCIVLTSLLCGFSAFANDSVNAKFSMVYGGVYAIEPTEVTVTADLSDKYESTVGWNDTAAQPTILDALIAAHLDLWGDISGLSCTSSGWLKTVFGMSDSVGYRLNGEYVMSLNDTINDNDYVDFAFYQDIYGYSDSYAWFDSREIQTEEGAQITLTAQCSGYDSSWNLVTLSCADIEVTANGEPVGKTDADGKITLSFDKEGTYSITTESYMGSTALFPPFCTVTVNQKQEIDVPSQTENKDESTTAKDEEPATDTNTVTKPDITAPTEPTTSQEQESTTTASSSNNAKAPSLSDVTIRMIAAADYLAEQASGYDVSSAMDYQILVSSGRDMSDFDDAFLSSVKENLDANNGKIIIDGSENIGVYGAVIQIIDALNLDAEDFEGYNIVDAFAQTDPAKTVENPYCYRYAIAAAADYGMDDFANALCQSYIDNYYVMDLGMNYYGYSCDNTANFITALSPYYDEFEEVINNAVNVLETYKVDGGYCYNPQYGTQPNCNSTAAALAAYASIERLDKAAECYNDLLTFESDNIGVFTYDGAENIFATKDALVALEYYAQYLEDENGEDTAAMPKEELEEEATADEKIAEEGSEENTVSKSENNTNTNKSTKSPDTGSNITAALFASITAAGIITLALKKRNDA